MARAAWQGQASRIGRGRTVFLWLLAASLLSAVTCRGQTVQQPGLPNASQSHTGLSPAGPAEMPNPLAGPNASKLEHMREDERHKRLTADTAKLVQLTNQLKEEVDKATKDELSLDVVRKAAEIEKLARDVKERMKS